MAQYITYSAHGLIPPRSRPLIPGGGPQTVAEVLDRWVRECPEADALVGRDRRYTYAELDEAANRAASALASLGVHSGTRVAASLPNRTDIVVAFLGAMRLGAIWVGINRPLAAPEKAYMIEDAQASVFLAAAEAAAEIEELSGRLPTLQHIVRVGEDPTDSP
ncbi:MAG: acyl--CoA ligase, partial [Myxococcales bacterium]|nr:acyl--CoA ligase [Myxococcales bacterium]